MFKFANRNILIQNYIRENMIGAELGVFIGDFAKILLQTNPKKLYLVDKFEGEVCCADHNCENWQSVNLEKEYPNVVHKFAPFSNVCVIKDTTENFLQTLPNEFLDFVYIDANHDYEAVKLDLQLSVMKTKTNGYIMGHDYTKELFPGVVNAVDEFCSANNLQIDGLSNCVCPTFCIIKR